MVDQQICTHCNCMKKTLETWVQTSFKNLLTNIFHFIQSRHLESCMHLPEQSLASVEEVSCVPEKLLHAIYFDINMSNQKPTARNKQHLITNMPKTSIQTKDKMLLRHPRNVEVQVENDQFLAFLLLPFWPLTILWYIWQPSYHRPQSPRKVWQIVEIQNRQKELLMLLNYFHCLFCDLKLLLCCDPVKAIIQDSITVIELLQKAIASSFACRPASFAVLGMPRGWKEKTYHH